MKTMVNEGTVQDFTVPSGGCVSGVGVLIGTALFGIAVTSNAAGDTASMRRRGTFDHVAEGAGSGQAWAIGDVIYWDNTNKRMTKTSASNTKVGVAIAAKITTDTLGRLELVPNV